MGMTPSIFSLSRHSILDELGKDYVDAEVIIDNLIKQRLIQFSAKQSYNRLDTFISPMTPERMYDPWEAQPKEKTESEKVIDYLKSTAEAAEDRSSLQLTPLGFALVKACNEPENNPTQK